MKRIATVILGIFFIALTANAFAGNLADDLKNAFGSVQKTTYDTLWVKPYMAGASVGKAISPHVNNVIKFNDEMTTARNNMLNTASTALTGVGINQHVNNTYNAAVGIGKGITNSVVYAFFTVPYNAGRDFDVWYHKTMNAVDDHFANSPTISLVDGHWEYPNGTIISAEEAGVNPSVAMILGLRKIGETIWGKEDKEMPKTAALINHQYTITKTRIPTTQESKQAGNKSANSALMPNLTMPNGKNLDMNIFVKK